MDTPCLAKIKANKIKKKICKNKCTALKITFQQYEAQCKTETERDIRKNVCGTTGDVNK